MHETIEWRTILFFLQKITRALASEKLFLQTFLLSVLSNSVWSISLTKRLNLVHSSLLITNIMKICLKPLNNLEKFITIACFYNDIRVRIVLICRFKWSSDFCSIFLQCSGELSTVQKPLKTWKHVLLLSFLFDFKFYRMSSSFGIREPSYLISC